jgi:hypothetical protein
VKKSVTTPFWSRSLPLTFGEPKSCSSSGAMCASKRVSSASTSALDS